MTTAWLVDRTDVCYRLGGRLFDLDNRAWAERSLIEVATLLEDLYVRTPETVHLGNLDSGEVVYLSKIGGELKVPSRRLHVLAGEFGCTALRSARLCWPSGGSELQESVLMVRWIRMTNHTVSDRGSTQNLCERPANLALVRRATRCWRDALPYLLSGLEFRINRHLRPQQHRDKRVHVYCVDGVSHIL